MINGLYLSQLQSVRQGYLSHQKKLAEINKNNSRNTHVNLSLQKILQDRKAYHVPNLLFSAKMETFPNHKYLFL